MTNAEIVAELKAEIKNLLDRISALEKREADRENVAKELAALRERLSLFEKDIERIQRDFTRLSHNQEEINKSFDMVIKQLSEGVRDISELRALFGSNADIKKLVINIELLNEKLKATEISLGDAKKEQSSIKTWIDQKTGIILVIAAGCGIGLTELIKFLLK